MKKVDKISLDFFSGTSRIRSSLPALSGCLSQAIEFFENLLSFTLLALSETKSSAGESWQQFGHTKKAKKKIDRF